MAVGLSNKRAFQIKNLTTSQRRLAGLEVWKTSSASACRSIFEVLNIGLRSGLADGHRYAETNQLAVFVKVRGVGRGIFPCNLVT